MKNENSFFNESSIKQSDFDQQVDLYDDNSISLEVDEKKNMNNENQIKNKNSKFKTKKMDENNSKINIDDLMAEIEHVPSNENEKSDNILDTMKKEDEKNNIPIHGELEDLAKFINSSFHPEEEEKKETKIIEKKEESEIKNLDINSLINKNNLSNKSFDSNLINNISQNNQNEIMSLGQNQNNEAGSIISNEINYIPKQTEEGEFQTFEINKDNFEEIQSIEKEKEAASQPVSLKNNYHNNSNIEVFESIKDLPKPIDQSIQKQLPNSETVSKSSKKKKPNLFTTISNQNKKASNNLKSNQTNISLSAKTIKDFPFFMCPFCNKDTPIITSLSSIKDPKTEIIYDKISTLCSCGGNTLPLREYISKLIKQNLSPNGNCYNPRHPSTLGIAFCGKCNRFLCASCLEYHNDYLPKHITSPYKIPTFSKCLAHINNDINDYCETCRIGLCDECTDHLNHSIISIDEYWRQLNEKLPFKTMNQCVEYTNSCTKIAENQKNKFIQYIDDFIKRLNKYKTDIEESYKKSISRVRAQAKLIQLTYSNFICFRKNYYQMQNMNNVSFICPTVYLCLDNDFLKGLKGYEEYVKAESIIEFNVGTKITKEEIDDLFSRYPITNKLTDLNESKSGEIIPILFKAFNQKGIYYGECVKKKRHGRGIQFNNNGDIYEGYWDNGKIIKGRIKYSNGNVYEGEIKEDKEDGYGTKTYKNGEEYKGYFREGRKVSQTFIEKIIEEK